MTLHEADSPTDRARARDYAVGEIGPSKWIRWGRLMDLLEAGAIHGYWSAQMVQRVAVMVSACRAPDQPLERDSDDAAGILRSEEGNLQRVPKPPART
jgi:hypothetical protein